MMKCGAITWLSVEDIDDPRGPTYPPVRRVMKGRISNLTIEARGVTQEVTEAQIVRTHEPSKAPPVDTLSLTLPNAHRFLCRPVTIRGDGYAAAGEIAEVFFDAATIICAPDRNAEVPVGAQGGERGF